MYYAAKTMHLLFVCGLMSLQTHLVYKCTLRRIYYNDSCTLILRNIFSIQLIFMHCEGGRESPATTLWKRMWSKLRAILNILLRLLQIIEIHFVYSKQPRRAFYESVNPESTASAVHIGATMFIHTYIYRRCDESRTLIT